LKTLALEFCADCVLRSKVGDAIEPTYQRLSLKEGGLLLRKEKEYRLRHFLRRLGIADLP
jgi:hypothetical protein